MEKTLFPFYFLLGGFLDRYLLGHMLYQDITVGFDAGLVFNKFHERPRTILLCFKLKT